MQRLYPFHTNDKNVMMLKGEDDAEQGHKVSMTAIKIGRKKVSKWSLGFKTEHDLVVSNEGFYFFKNMPGPDEHGVARPNNIILSNLAYSTYGTERVDDFIDPTIIATRRVNKKLVDIYGVNVERNELVLYNKKAEEGQSYKHVDIPEAYYHLVRNTKEKFGLTLLKLKEGDSQIHAIALLHDNNMAIAYANGEIVLGAIENNAWVAKKQLLKAAEEHVGLTLLSTPNGKLIAYVPKADTLMGWDIAHAHAFYMQACPKLSKLNLSNDGNHLTALLGVDAASDLILCYQLPTMQLQTIKMAEPISDVAICEGDKVQVLSQNGETVHFPGKLANMLKHGEHPVPLNKVPNKEKVKSFFAHKHEEAKPESTNTLKK